MKKSMMTAFAATVMLCCVAEVSFAQVVVVRPIPVGFPPVRIGKAVAKGSAGVGKAVAKGTSGIGKGASGIGRAIGKGASGIGRGIGRAAARGTKGPGFVPGPFYRTRIPLGYQTLKFRGHRYYYYSRLPVGYRPISVRTHQYYVCDNVYYEPYSFRKSTIYVVVPPPL